MLFSGSLALSQGLVLQPILTFYLTLASAADTSVGGNTSMYAVLVQGDTSQQLTNLINVELPIYIVCTQNGSTTPQVHASEQVL